jgi:hypothetical protein
LGTKGVSVISAPWIRSTRYARHSFVSCLKAYSRIFPSCVRRNELGPLSLFYRSTDAKPFQCSGTHKRQRVTNLVLSSFRSSFALPAVSLARH